MREVSKRGETVREITGGGGGGGEREETLRETRMIESRERGRERE